MDDHGYPWITMVNRVIVDRGTPVEEEYPLKFDHATGATVAVAQDEAIFKPGFSAFSLVTSEI